MSFEAARAAIFGTFKQEFGLAYPTTKVYYENQKFEQPVGQPWVSIAFIPNLSRRADIGTVKHFKHEGVVNVNVMVPEDTGTKTMHEMADKVFTVLADRDWGIGDNKVTTYGVQRRSRGVVAGYYVHNIQCEFCLDASLDR